MPSDGLDVFRAALGCARRGYSEAIARREALIVERDAAMRDMLRLASVVVAMSALLGEPLDEATARDVTEAQAVAATSPRSYRRRSSRHSDGRAMESRTSLPNPAPTPEEP